MSIIGFLLSIPSLFGKLLDWFSGRAQQKAGADAQTVRDLKTAEPVQKAMTEAVMNAPKTKSAALDRLRRGDA